MVECRFGHFHRGHLFGPDRLRQCEGVHLPQFSAACHGRSSWCCSSLNRACGAMLLQSIRNHGSWLAQTLTLDGTLRDLISKIHGSQWIISLPAPGMKKEPKT